MALPMLLEMALAANNNRPALQDDNGVITYRELARRATGIAVALRRTGASSCAFVGVNSPAVPALLFGAALAGVPFSPLNYRLAETHLHALLHRLPDPLVVSDGAYRSVVDDSGLEVVTTAALLAEAATASEPTHELVEPVTDDDIAVLLFTSGTTAEPKCVVLRHDTLVNYVLQTVEFGAASPEESALTCVPPYHVAAIGSTLTNVYSGRRLCYLPDFTPARWLHTVRAAGATSAMLVPTMLARLVEHLDGVEADVPTLQSLAYGGARLPLPVLERAMRAFPGVGFVNAYGLTETSSTIAVLGPDDHRAALASDEPAVRARLSSAGRLVPGVEGQVRDETGTVLPPGVSGELWVRGPQVSGEYVELGSMLDDDGWFPTHDRARFDNDGYLFIEGRADETIIRGAENVAPGEIEDLLADHADVRDVGVVGLPDEEWGERIAAMVVLQDDARTSPEELREWVRTRLRSSRTPDEIHLRPELPYTPTGKLIRRELVHELTTPSTERSSA
jgi:acyl-CoA synthetase (AMP-forming)/AMP-acid ligase II